MLTYAFLKIAEMSKKQRLVWVINEYPYLAQADRGISSRLQYVVLELLWRMKDNTNFATVFGQHNNSTNLEALYRKCGFIGFDVWHALKKR